MRVVITGAGGFIGGVLAHLLQTQPRFDGRAVQTVMLVDQRAPTLGDARFCAVEGDLGSERVLDRIFEARPDVVFHLASMPGGAAEADYLTGRKINLDAMLALFEALARMPRGSGTAPPRVINASTVAVYRFPLPDLVDDTAPLQPPLTYGAHKLISEVVLADFTRRGLLDGCSLRLPGIVARPRAPSGLTSAFMSDLLHALKAGERFTCPVSPHASAWWMSARRCAENLLHAAVMEMRGADSRRAWPLPVLRLSFGEVVDTLARLYGEDRRELVHYAPQEHVETVFGRYPRLDDRAARALGLRDDGTPEALIRRALGEFVAGELVPGDFVPD
jgi:D-erythronate 2-dehydrogenase